MPGVPQDDQYALEEAQCAEVVDVALDAGSTFCRRCYVRLAGQPSQDALGGRLVTSCLGFPVAPQGGTEHWRRGGDLGQTLLQQFTGAADQSLLVVRANGALSQHVLLQGIKPAVHDVAECPLGRVSRGEPLHEPAVDGLQTV